MICNMTKQQLVSFIVENASVIGFGEVATQFSYFNCAQLCQGILKKIMKNNGSSCSGVYINFVSEGTIANYEF